MEVLANGMKVQYWIGVEEEPDIDRYVDEQIMIDMDRFMLVGTLLQVKTCKKKNEEREWDYFKQITVEVNNICLASDNDFNIQIPGKKDEFLYEVKFRYLAEPVQDIADAGGPIEQAAAAAEADAADERTFPVMDEQQKGEADDVDYFVDKAKKATKSSIEDLEKEIAALKATPGDYEKQIETYQRAIDAMKSVTTADVAKDAAKLSELADNDEEKEFLDGMAEKENEMDAAALKGDHESPPLDELIDGMAKVGVDAALNMHVDVEAELVKHIDDGAGDEIAKEVAEKIGVSFKNELEAEAAEKITVGDDEILNQNAADTAAEVDAEVLAEVIEKAKAENAADGVTNIEADIDAAMDEAGDQVGKEDDTIMDNDADFDESMFDDPDTTTNAEDTGYDPDDDDVEYDPDADDPEDAEFFESETAPINDLEMPDPEADTKNTDLDDEGINWGDE